MSEDSIQPSSATVSGDSNEEIDAELLAEYQREIERHEAAVRMVKQREQEAIEAKMRFNNTIFGTTSILSFIFFYEVLLIFVP